MEEIVAVAREYGLFIICDEIYAHICYNGASPLHLSEVLGDVPAMSLRGISKEYPWPGARCGWIEFLNRRRDPRFEEYARAILLSKMMEVCSTTLPQMSIPRVMGDDRYAGHLAARAETFAARAEEAYAAFSGIDGVIVNRTQGAFYFTVVFEEGVLNDRQTLPIENPEVRTLVEELTRGVPPDKRFVYYLMGSEGICVTPLSGFQAEDPGFRITYLQDDDSKRRNTLERLAGAVRSYLAS
jgi:aspartate/methionine/tyrosine aminotransferase